MPTELHRNDVGRMIADGAQLLDVLPTDEYEAEHLTGALSIPLKTLDAATTAGLDRDRPVIVYCWDTQ
ncbi:MAG: rhodanese-like domain-containing protein [Chloroflexota bacterium]|nr:rhodanese-like domain-containing protein [Chloroflexia bacterium]MDQ3167165.1 rhodanese-like domain-containing protein [Chloroflexota bacterium]